MTATATRATTTPVDVDDVAAVLSSLSALIRTSRAIGRRLLDESGTSSTPLAVLKVLARGDGHDRPGDLAVATGVAPSVVSRVIARLEEDGLVTRRKDDVDARACHIALTDAGTAHLEHVHREAAARLAPELAGIPAEDLHRMPHLLQELEQAIARAERLPAHHATSTTESH
ncbi:MarR family winged helix-turn-helix transcriptional regulator [Knoellia koreensis]|uniref:Winged helix-turn-helix transcriptional regulator n=1 Tax=Knoellia koreensis TaxID=2730921 RepID=A0A849HJ22_9MICO|nr:MarR family winged helix-turn-helix transcriptional regulator [Knoellia sp. DB2414S]NNM47262.1 winged helix-turn-helix transcriptional regulator [Knoellia sp. DB2414S]